MVQAATRGDGATGEDVTATGPSAIETVADAAGRWAAAKAPPVIPERLLPRFIDSFRAAA